MHTIVNLYGFILVLLCLQKKMRIKPSNGTRAMDQSETEWTGNGPGLHFV